MIRVHLRAVLLCAALSPMSAWAATYCVSPNPTAPDEISLNSAIANWRNAFDPVTIKLQQGTYTSLVGNLYDADYTDLSLLGGYYAVAGDSCGGRTLNAKNTVVQGSLKILNIVPTTLTVEGMTFSGYDSILLGSGKTTLLSEIIVTGGSSSSGIALTFGANDGGVATLRNSLVYGNHTSGGAVRATYDPGFADPGNTVYLINDTIAGNDGDGLSMGEAGYPVSEQIVGFNNIFYGNTGTDLVTTYADTVPVFLNTLVGDTTGNFLTGGSLFLTSTDPKFAGDYSLLGNSPAINKGTSEASVPGGYADFDLVGNTRVLGSAIDLGAYEHSGTLYVTNTNDDSSVGSLRWAINAVNGNNSVYDEIRFNIAPGGGCPQMITLASPLPTLTSNVTINGYTEPGAAYNIVANGYNGNLCVIVNGAGNVDRALWAVSGQMTVKGIEFEGFKADAVLISGGTGHKVVGNGFAARPGSLKNLRGVRVNGSATLAQIGSSKYVFDRNVFDQNDVNILLAPASGNAGNHTIAGNLIGFNFDTTLWSGPVKGYYGIDVVGGGHTIDGNFIGGMGSHGIALSGPAATGNVITNNTIGGASYGNIGAGIDISGGAHDNVVGTVVFGTDDAGGNVIAFNAGPGIAIEDAGSTGNRVDGDNSIYANGGLAIDLGSDESTSNDAGGGDADTGPNNLQNFPVLSQAVRLQDGTVRVTGQLQVDHTGVARGYRFDLFLVDDIFCGRRDLETHLDFFIRNTNGLVDVSWSNLGIVAGLTPGIVPDVTGKSLVATATDPAGNTSEPSQCVPLKEDRIFKNGLGNPG